MVKALFLNDTSSYHAGSVASVAGIRRVLDELDVEVVRSVTTAELVDVTCADYLERNDYDVCIVNGEGTLHNNTFGCRELIRAMSVSANRHGMPLALVNTLIYDIDESLRWTASFNENSVILARDMNSFVECCGSGVETHHVPDASLIYMEQFQASEVGIPTAPIGVPITYEFDYKLKGKDANFARTVESLAATKGARFRISEYHALIACWVAGVPFNLKRIESPYRRFKLTTAMTELMGKDPMQMIRTAPAIYRNLLSLWLQRVIR